MQKTHLVIGLDLIQDDDAALVGNKAFSLNRMSRTGLPVPSGFCITAAAFREHLERNNLTGRIISTLKQLSTVSPPAQKSALLELREAIEQGSLANELREQIEQYYQALGAKHVAVRSSATVEDLPEQSFAGQYDTYLGVTDLADCIDAIKKCWASLWTERAYNYRRKNGFDHLKVNMAVIVQSLVEANASGVLFTADPRFGPSGNIVIEACFGLGQALVSGRVTPDRFVVHRKKLWPLFHEISEKKIECVLDSNGSVKEQVIPDERSTAPSLDKKQIKQLAKLAGKVETEFGCPQDIEWAVCKNRIYLLQSRPITGMPKERSWEDRQIWSANPVREVMPDVVTPVTLSMFLEAIGQELFDPIFRMFGCDRGDHPIYSIIAGRIYFNANIWAAGIRRLPGIRSVDLTELSGDHKELRELADRIQTVPEEDLPDIKFSLLRFLLKMPLNLHITGAFFNNSEKSRRILAQIRTENEKWNRLDLSSLSAEQFIAHYQEPLMEFRRLLGHLLHVLSVFISFPVLDLICKRWLSADSSCAGRLLAGVGDMDDAAAGLDLWQLAAAADETPEVKDLILSGNNWQTIETKLSQLDSGRKFLANWSKFMDRHGHHCRAELELYNPRWSETPDYILKLVRTYISQIGEIDPIKNYNQRLYERQQLEQQCRKKLRNPIKRMIFNRVLARSQKGSSFRENVKSEVVRLVATLRKILLGLGRKLLDKGVLENQDDIFFLRFDEIVTVVEGNTDFDVHPVIAARRAEYNKNKSIMPPDVIFGKFDPNKYAPESVDASIETLNGLAVSPGVVTGKARVILRADTDEQVLAGEVLVAPFTDPGWTPYFVTAAAVVMDQGGILSHGSIVAREYGIPAVVNVGHATKIIKTGQTVEIDGDRGVIRILK